MTTLYLYRVDAQGKKTRWAFDLDDKTIISERPMPESDRETPDTMGIQYRTEPNGTRVITGVDVRTREALNFFIPSRPCWFDGCEELRARYEQELEAAGGDGCTGCKKGTLQRKYMPQVLDAMRGS